MDDVEGLIVRLLDEPRRLSELEKAVGRISMSFRSDDHENMGFLVRPRPGQRGEHSALVPRLSVRYAWDRFHQDPTRPRDVELVEYTLHLRGDQAAVERVLAGRFGPPRHVTERVPAAGGAVATVFSEYGRFYVTDGPPDGVRLTWFSTAPRFAIPEPDSLARRSWLGRLAGGIATARTVDEVGEVCRAAGDGVGVGVEVRGTSNTGLNPYAEFEFPLPDARDLTIAFSPPVPALMVVEAFGWDPAVGVSSDVHMASWHVERRGAGWLPISGALQHWEIKAALSGPPAGAADANARPGPSMARAIGATDEVVILTIRPRFR